MRTDERVYKALLRSLLRNYIVGSAVAVIGVGGAFIFTTLRISGSEVGLLAGTLALSFFIMIAAETVVFRRHLQPLRVLFRESPGRSAQPLAQQAHVLREAYLRTHRLPELSVQRTLGPHLFGLAIPGAGLALLEIRAGWLHLPLSYVAFACVGALLVAGMHALIEFYLASASIRPTLQHLLEVGQAAGVRLSLDGRVLVSIRSKFLQSALLIGTVPLLLFTLAASIRLRVIAPGQALEFWQWAVIILIIGILFSAIGAWLLWQTAAQPIGQLQAVMRQVQQGELEVRATDLYSDEFSRLVAGFNHMVEGLRTREQMNADLIESYFATLAAALDARDPYTAGHSVRVAHYAVQIARRAELADSVTADLRRSALLHDIGKIGVRDAVLLKDGKLTEDEFAQIKRHPELGEAILLQVQPQDAMAPLLPGVRSHHERWDGKGYPDGLEGERIPLFGRILAVADAFDAMTSDRPYRKGMPIGRARAILMEGAGSQWDAQFVNHFVDWLDEAGSEVATGAY
ncbi:MAG: HD domain-containing protein, partial [Firmicutes bacterium]|nr:HD domain-containing protein [Bacillota bacterium]